MKDHQDKAGLSTRTGLVLANIALPTDGLLYEAELAHCCSCECESQNANTLELERMQLENEMMKLELTRRQKRLDAGELDPFEPAPLPESEV